MSQGTKHSCSEHVNMVLNKEYYITRKRKKKMHFKYGENMSKELGRTMEYSEGLRENCITQEVMNGWVCSVH